jgi:hypothetical protein
VRTPLAIIAVLLAILVPIGFLTDDGPEPAAEPSAPVATIAKRVQVLRGLRYEAIPKPQRVSARQAQREGAADFDRTVPVADQRADEALYTLLGLYPPGTSVKELTTSIFGEQVAGYYDPRSKRLRIVEGAGSANRVLDEMVIAHELDHALEDQAIGLDAGRAERSDDPGLAYAALVEGAATSIMYEYVGRYFKADVALGGLLGGAFASPSTGDLPPFVVQGLLFPYLSGLQFVSALRAKAGRRWTLVDLAERSRPPVSTEQVLHPDKWLAVEVPDRVTLPDPGAGWRPLTAGTFGEWQTGQLLQRSGADARRAAAGWGGDRYALWRRGSGPCGAPCPRRDLLVMRWRWDTAADATEFAAALRGAVEEGLGRGGAARVRAQQRQTTLVLAPDEAAAARVGD